MKFIKFKNNKFIWQYAVSVISYIIISNFSLLVAHPFDQVRADSSSYFKVEKNIVHLKIKFPVHAFINLWVKSPQEYDAFAIQIESKKEIAHIKKYISSHILIFDEKNKLDILVGDLKYIKDAYLSDQTPQFIELNATFRQKQIIKSLYIFNKLFDEGKVPHFGSSEIEISDKVFDFTFQKKKYFHYTIDSHKK